MSIYDDEGEVKYVVTSKQDSDAEKWLKDNDWDYSKYGDRRGDRSAYDTMMRYEISGLLEWAFDAGRASMKAEVMEVLRSEKATELSWNGPTKFNEDYADWLEEQLNGK